MRTHKVVVMMPFGGETRETKRRAILEYLRLKYILSKKTAGLPNGCDYDVRVVSLQSGNIQVEAVQEVLRADLSVCLLSEENVNVAFELAVRCLRDVPILIVKSNAERLVPVYLKQYASINYDTPGEVQRQMEVLAAGEFPFLDWDGEIPPGLAEAIDAHDRALIESLKTALHQSARERAQRSPIKNLMLSYAAEEAVADLVKKGLYQRWETYSPCSTVEIRWKTQSEQGRYKADDVEAGPSVIDYNTAFSELYNFTEPRAHGNGKLTLASLLDRLQPFVEPESFAAFEEDQKHLTDEIVFKGGYAQTRAALRITEDHPRPGMRNRLFLPCLVAKDTVAVDRQAPHSVYLIIQYTDITEAITS